MISCFSRLLLALSLTLTVPAVAVAGKLGQEFIVTKKGVNSSIARLSNGNFVVIWRSDAPKYAIQGQRYGNNGSPIGSVFTVTPTSPELGIPFIAGFGNSAFVVVWEAPDQNGLGVWMQLYKSNGQKDGGKVRVNKTQDYDQHDATAVGIKDGSFFVLWTSDFQDGSTSAVYAKHFSKGGATLKNEFRVDSTLPGGPHHLPSAAATTNGGFVAVWRAYNGTTGQRFNKSGGAVGGEFQVNAVNEGLLQHPVVAGLKDGGFAVAREVQDFSAEGERDIFVQRYKANGTKAGGDIRANKTKQLPQFDPAMTDLANGGFVVVWSEDGGPQSHIAEGRLFDADGKPVGGDFKINTSVVPIDARPAVGRLGNGFVATWQGSATNATFTVRGQRFDGK